MIRYEASDTRLYFNMYLVSREIKHLETAIDRNKDFAFILCMEYRLLKEYKSIVSNSRIEYKPLRIA